MAKKKPPMSPKTEKITGGSMPDKAAKSMPKGMRGKGKMGGKGKPC